MSTFVLTLLLFIFVLIGNSVLIVWGIGAFLLNMSLVHGLPSLCVDCIVDYPKEMRITPAICKFLFQKIPDSPHNGRPKELFNDGIPKEVYHIGLVEFLGFWFYTATAFILCCLIGTEAAIHAGRAYITVAFGFHFIAMVIAERKSFLSRYKVFTRHTIRFFMSGKEDLNPEEIGICRIIDVYYKKRNRVATVCMIGSEDKVLNVVIPPEIAEYSTADVWTLFRIGDVFYLDQLRS